MASEQWQILENIDRQDSFSSVELDKALEKDTSDSVKFAPTIGPTIGPTMGPQTSPPKVKLPSDGPESPVSNFVKNLILSSKAMNAGGVGETDLKRDIYTLRKLAKGFGGYSMKAEFARAYKSVQLPQFEDPEPEYESHVVPEKYCEYALEKGREAIKELKEKVPAENESLKKVESCVTHLLQLVQQWKEDA